MQLLSLCLPIKSLAKSFVHPKCADQPSLIAGCVVPHRGLQRTHCASDESLHYKELGLGGRESLGRK